MKRAGCSAGAGPESGTGIRARSSRPNGPSLSSAAPPEEVSDSAISSRTSAQMPALRGAANAWICSALRPSTIVAATTCSSWTSTRTSQPSGTGTRMAPRSSRASSSSTSSTSYGPPGRAGRGVSTSSTTASSAGSSRPRRNSGTSSSFDGSSSIVAVTAGGSKPALGARRAGQLGDLDELRVLDPLDDQLGDAVAAAQPDRVARVQVDDDNLDLAAVAGVDGAWRVDQ